MFNKMNACLFYKRCPDKILWLALGLNFIIQSTSLSQKITLNPQKTFQTMHSFGASDCWSMAMVGKYYPQEKKK